MAPDEREFIPFLKRVEQAAQSVICAGYFSIPVHDPAVYAALLREASQLALQQDDPDLLVLMDMDTAAELPEGELVAGKAHRIVLFGDVFPLQWQSADDVEKRPYAPPMHEDDRILLLLSGTVSLALFGQHAHEFQQAPQQLFHGGWTIQRSTVMHLAEVLLGDSAAELLRNLSERLGEEDRISASAMRLAALHADALQSREHMTAVEKSDLLSVLEILKAISGKRSAHDILYVFVEQIARIVDTDRCSVVRISNSEHEGHVEASHEDASVSGRIIDLKKYPELLATIGSGEKVVIDDVTTHPLTMEFAEAFRKTGLRSLVVIPVVINNDQVDTLLLRAVRRDVPFTLREISFLEIVAEAAANALERAQMFDTIQQANDRLEKLAVTDGLTGLYNCRYFHEQFKKEYDRTIRYKHPLSCIMADVDDFKRINDTYGHLVGDAVLQEIARRIVAATRSVDIAARYGGEEFAIILPSTDKSGARTEAERLRRVISEQPYKEVPEDTTITISLGVATFNARSMKSPKDLLRAADIALYEAKHTGKNRVVTYNAGKKDIKDES